MSRQSLGYALMALAVASAGLGAWRLSVRLFGTPDDHLLPQLVPDDRRPEALTRDVETRSEEVASAKRSGDAEKLQKAEERLRYAEGRRATGTERWDKIIARSYKTEGLLGIAGLLAACWFGRWSWRCFQPVRDTTAN